MPTPPHWSPAQPTRSGVRMRPLRKLPASALLVIPIWAGQAVNAGPRMPATVIPETEQVAAIAAEPAYDFGSGWPRQDGASERLAAGNGPGTASQGGMSESPVAPRSDPWPAPIGHRQPQIQDLPANVRQEEGEVTRSEHDLDKVIGNICRGC